MGINISASSSLGSFSSQFFFPFFFFKGNMNLTVFAGILLAVTMATARRASLVEKIMQAADEAEKPDEAKRQSAEDAAIRLVDGNTLYEGRIEIFHAGRWGTICSGYGAGAMNNAKVACKQLGYGEAILGPSRSRL